MRSTPLVNLLIVATILAAGCAPVPATPLPSTAPAVAAIARDPAAPIPKPTSTARPAASALSGLLARPLPAPRRRAALPTVTPAPVRLPTVTPAPAASFVVSGTVNAPQVNVRSGPGTNYPAVGKVAAPAGLRVVGRNEAGDWLAVCCQGATGGSTDTPVWVSAEFITLVLPKNRRAADLPVTASAPPPVGVAVAGSSNRSAADLAAASAADLPPPGNFSPPAGVDPLTGLPGDVAGKRPIIVCINNDYAARPQWGTGQADVVYEYLMEGYGITRFSAIFYGQPAPQIGPVRSARLINYFMGALYNAGLTCSGASDPVRYALKHDAPFPYMDIDLDDASNIRYSDSVGSDYRTRLRTDTARLRTWLADWGVEQAGGVRGFTFGNLPAGGAPATTISIPYPGGSDVSYRYDPGSGRYLRSLAGEPHVDGNTGRQLALDNVIVQVVPHEATNIVEDSLGSTSIRLNLFGSGPAIVFRNGQAFPATWRSDSRGDTPHFVAANGAEIPLKPGQSWISVVPSTYTVGYE